MFDERTIQVVVSACGSVFNATGYDQVQIIAIVSICGYVSFLMSLYW
jgi:hypothetical protein